MQAAGFNRPPQGPAGTEQVRLPRELVQVAGPHAVGKGSGIGIHGRAARRAVCRQRSSMTSAPAGGVKEKSAGSRSTLRFTSRKLMRVV